jgi:hypothetical protein
VPSRSDLPTAAPSEELVEAAVFASDPFAKLAEVAVTPSELTIDATISTV